MMIVFNGFCKLFFTPEAAPQSTKMISCASFVYVFKDDTHPSDRRNAPG